MAPSGVLADCQHLTSLFTSKCVGESMTATELVKNMTGRIQSQCLVGLFWTCHSLCLVTSCFILVNIPFCVFVVSTSCLCLFSRSLLITDYFHLLLITLTCVSSSSLSLVYLILCLPLLSCWFVLVVFSVFPVVLSLVPFPQFGFLVSCC